MNPNHVFGLPDSAWLALTGGSSARLQAGSFPGIDFGTLTHPIPDGDAMPTAETSMLITLIKCSCGFYCCFY